MTTTLRRRPAQFERLTVTDEQILDWLENDFTVRDVVGQVVRESEHVSIPGVGRFTREVVRDRETSEVLYVSFSH